MYMLHVYTPMCVYLYNHIDIVKSGQMYQYLKIHMQKTIETVKKSMGVPPTSISCHGKIFLSHVIALEAIMQLLRDNLTLWTSDMQNHGSHLAGFSPGP